MKQDLDENEINEELQAEAAGEAEEAKEQNEPEIIIRELKCRLTQEELDSKVSELVQITNVKIPIIESTKKLAMKRFAAELDELSDKAFKIGNIFISKCEERKVECIWRYNAKSKKMDLIRLQFEDPKDQAELGHFCDMIKSNPVDDWEERNWYHCLVVETRDLTSEEKQLQLEFKKKSEARPEQEQAEEAKLKKRNPKKKGTVNLSFELDGQKIGIPGLGDLSK